MLFAYIKTPWKHIVLQINRTILCLFLYIPLKKEHERWDNYLNAEIEFLQ